MSADNPESVDPAELIARIAELQARLDQAEQPGPHFGGGELADFHRIHGGDPALPTATDDYQILTWDQTGWSGATSPGWVVNYLRAH